jgi:hypothetical protein
LIALTFLDWTLMGISEQSRRFVAMAIQLQLASRHRPTAEAGRKESTLTETAQRQYLVEDAEPAWLMLPCAAAAA